VSRPGGSLPARRPGRGRGDGAQPNSVRLRGRRLNHVGRCTVGPVGERSGASRSGPRIRTGGRRSIRRRRANAERTGRCPDPDVNEPGQRSQVARCPRCPRCPRCDCDAHKPTHRARARQWGPDRIFATRSSSGLTRPSPGPQSHAISHQSLGNPSSSLAIAPHSRCNSPIPMPGSSLGRLIR
jgi:hypothetical protein